MTCNCEIKFSSAFTIDFQMKMRHVIAWELQVFGNYEMPSLKQNEKESINLSHIVHTLNNVETSNYL